MIPCRAQRRLPERAIVLTGSYRRCAVPLLPLRGKCIRNRLSHSLPPSSSLRHFVAAMKEWHRDRISGVLFWGLRMIKLPDAGLCFGLALVFALKAHDSGDNVKHAGNSRAPLTCGSVLYYCWLTLGG
jgi:hypothetical protein